MLNRIRVVTMLMSVLVVFALLQLVSGGLFFSSLKQNQQSFAVSMTCVCNKLSWASTGVNAANPH